MFPDTGTEAGSGYTENLSFTMICPDCKEDPPNLIEEFSAGDVVCASCGRVLGGRIIDTRSEWRTFTNDDGNGEDPSRVGEVASSLAIDEGLRTQVDMSKKGANTKMAGKLNSIQKKSTHSSDKSNNDLQDGFDLIGRYVGNMDQSAQSSVVTNTAMHIYKLAYEHGQLKGKSKEAIVASCVFIACRQVGSNRTFRDLHNSTGVPKKEIGRMFKSLESFLTKIQERNPGASAAQGVRDYKTSTSTSAEDLCTRYCSALGFINVMRVEKIAKALARKTSSIADLAGRSPLSVAAACIYFASYYLGEPKTSREIAGVAGVSDGTIKTAYRFLYQVKDTVVEDGWDGNLEKLPVN
jgi:transcription initiation factor TFIIB